MKSSTELKTKRPFGTWKSPISSTIATDRKMAFVGLITEDDLVYWNEMRCHQEGRYVVCSSDREGTSLREWTPAGFSARTRVHEYGGGDFFVHGKIVYFSNFSDQVLYRQIAPGATPEALVDRALKYRYADGRYCPQTSKIYCVREDLEVMKTGAAEHENTIVAIDPETKEQTILIKGSDFYMSPRISSTGKHIAWVQWSHPNMPWDSTEIWKGQLSECGTTLVKGSVKKVVGGKDANDVDLSVMEPTWTTKGKLMYIGDQTNWWNLYKTKGAGEHVNLRPVAIEIGGPVWRLGSSSYAQDPGVKKWIITAFDGELGLLDRRSKRYTQIVTGYSHHAFLGWADSSCLYCIAYSETKFEHIIRVRVDRIRVNSGCSCLCPPSSVATRVDIVRVSMMTNIPHGYISIPRAITWKTTDDETSRGWYYPPKNKDNTSPDGELPPLLVRVHQGPTLAFTTGLDLELQYFTSRGFSVLCVDHRGSTRYGKQYRHRLRNMWGAMDVEDCCTGVQYLVEKGFADPERLCIDGSSAGGFTTYGCLTFHNVFKVGVCRSGICDLNLLFEDTHKFERHYCDTLLAPRSLGGQDVYYDRSPINHIEKLNAPIAIFHGDEDMIVPPNQAQSMFEAVKAKGIPTSYVVFKGEQHDFRKSRNLQVSLDGEFYFFAKILGFVPDEQLIEIEIINMKNDSTSEGLASSLRRRTLTTIRRSFCKVRFIQSESEEDVAQEPT